MRAVLFFAVAGLFLGGAISFQKQRAHVGVVVLLYVLGALALLYGVSLL
ncbi:hypothetical protein [Carbonactinospora thermoautotrophica]|uniref:Uncharacterized protein n=1 Tax=Carbonactinospora thermoautotrophica TaxID=1469144 RepID=A0A132MQ27_9ACTN|nr:hypothetical protein [Carbonactinospora thermoautotrophica]KWW99835.1 hypothetical protein LI90_1474 [Carbonactinospora thermoautotrophica]